MNVVVYGATGNSGSAIVKELLSRGHKVTAVARKVSSLKAEQGLTTKVDDLSKVDAIAAIITGADAVVSAYAPPSDDTNAILGVTERQIAAVNRLADPSAPCATGEEGLCKSAAIWLQVRPCSTCGL